MNASMLALLKADGTVAAASVGLFSAGELIVDPGEDQLLNLTASGCFALLFADQDA